jgi:hypothetical protein
MLHCQLPSRARYSRSFFAHPVARQLSRQVRRLEAQAQAGPPRPPRRSCGPAAFRRGSRSSPALRQRLCLPGWAPQLPLTSPLRRQRPQCRQALVLLAAMPSPQSILRPQPRRRPSVESRPQNSRWPQPWFRPLPPGRSRLRASKKSPRPIQAGRLLWRWTSRLRAALLRHVVPQPPPISRLLRQPRTQVRRPRLKMRRPLSQPTTRGRIALKASPKPSPSGRGPRLRWEQRRA